MDQNLTFESIRDKVKKKKKKSLKVHGSKWYLNLIIILILEILNNSQKQILGDFFFLTDQN